MNREGFQELPPTEQPEEGVTTGPRTADEVRELREAIERAQAEIMEEGISESREANLQALQEALRNFEAYRDE